MSQQSTQAPAFVTPLTPESRIPAVDEKKEKEWEPETLEEALLGEPSGDPSF